MRLTPIDLLNKRFARAWRGYTAAAVDDFLREVERDFGAVVAENAHLKEKLESLERELQRYQSMEETLKRALVLAEKTAGETCEHARREAERMLGEAQEKAADLRRASEAELEETRRQRTRFVRDFRGLLQTYLDSLECGSPHPGDQQAGSEHGEP